MEPESELRRTAARYRRRIIWLTLPTFVTLAVELIGLWRFTKDMYSESYAIQLGPLYPLVWLAFAFIIVGPLIIVQGFITVFSNWNAFRVQKGRLSALLLLLTISLLLSMFSCFWSCGGHPTWTGGYR
jgi:hypothetical protein